MTGSPSVPPLARAAFVSALAELSDHAAALPDPLPLGRVLSIVDACARASPDQLSVLAGEDERGYFLDYYRIDQDRDGETSHHGRVRADGSLESLENYEGQYGREIFPDDPARTEAELQRILAHNARVTDVLCAKGFLRDGRPPRDLTCVPLVWTHTGDAEVPYTTEVQGRRHLIRINDFPAEPLYTVLVDGTELMDLEDWPAAWVMPAPPASLLALVAPKS